MGHLSPGAARLAAEQARDRPPQGHTYCRVAPGTITAVTAGAASDGEDLVTVSYAGTTQDAAYPSTYTPLVGHTVNLMITSDGALFILGRFIGTP